ncbi:hypothetical protein M3A96_07790 [Helcobacillus massiliensis]|nr:hypothetical protein [Helcobacillus massiliensis]MCT1558014.1 hypothetical protein [Helcobacillus massiliensis]MCT2036736.1 hypothetical protein [Helcobacillus massiliensis]MCT2330794.1 hypothetical protein [Helcobacillus massiliensis]
MQSDHGGIAARNGVRAANWAAVIIAYIVLFIVVVAIGTPFFKDRAEH